jgi:muconolactone delta-isomerase
MSVPSGITVKYRFPWWLRPFLLRGVLGITIGKRVYIESDDPGRTLRHELAHVRQIERLGRIRFYWRWLREYAAYRVHGHASAEAYRRISFEIEAFAAEDVEPL